MKFLTLLTAVSVLGFGQAAPKQAPLPGAASILDRYIEVTGGREAYLARSSEIAHGTVEFPAMGLTGTLTRYSSAERGAVTVMDLPGLGAMVSGVTDGVAWERSDLMGPRVKQGAERAEALRDADLHGPAKWREQYPKVETIGTETVDGEDCYVVKMTPAEGSPVTQYFSRKTGLALKLTTTSLTQMGEVPVEVRVSEYKEFGGILEPATMIQKAAGQDLTLHIQSVERNPQIPADKLDLPADVAAIAKPAQ